jgi:hypothetical protein
MTAFCSRIRFIKGAIVLLKIEILEEENPASKQL